MAHSIFSRKPLALLLEEAKGENRLRRILGPVQLTSLGVGAIIGTGIFVLTGQAAHDKTGSSLMLSFVAAGIACVFAALCYAECASMVPVAGSAYTYAYTSPTPTPRWESSSRGSSAGTSSSSTSSSSSSSSWSAPST